MANPASQLHIEDLLVPAAYLHSVSHLRLEQTHISWVILTGRFAYKIKKAVHYPFLDTTALERRRALCEEEVLLNRRFAPDLYMDVVAIVLDGKQLKVNANGEPVEYAVRMCEFDPAQKLSDQLAEDRVGLQDMQVFAVFLADAYMRLPVAAPDTRYGTFECLRGQMMDNFLSLRTHLRDSHQLKKLEQLSQWTEDALERLRPAIQARKQLGLVRECHGDLHARNVVRWHQRWLPFDCLEFNPELRWIDVLNDVSFLFMDVAARGRDGLAWEFLSTYIEQTGDYEGLPLLPLYSAYRALVRAKVDALGAKTVGAEEREALHARLAERLEDAAKYTGTRSPVLVLMHGVTACGKSWLSERLVSVINAVRIRSDIERRRPMGMAPLTHRISGPGHSSYTSEAIQKTYDRLLENADSALQGECSTIIDATFLNAAHREMFRELAWRRQCRFMIVSCYTDMNTLHARLNTRALNPLDPSEATHAVLDEQLRTQHPLTSEEGAHTVRVDTSWLVSADAGIQDIRKRLADETQFRAQ